MAVFGRGMRMNERDGRKWGDSETGRREEKEKRRRGDKAIRRRARVSH
jgi:hypothetical protein